METRLRNYSTITLSGGMVFLTGLVNSITHIFHSFIAAVKERPGLTENPTSQSSGFERRSKMPSRLPSKTIKIIIIAVIVIVALYALSKTVNRFSGSSSPLPAGPDVKPPKATISLNKEVTFPLKGAKGEKVADVKYLIETAELRDEILVKGARATAVKGRIFLILTIKISNEYKSPIQINTKDYVRLSVNGNENEWLAPDIHNDPVEVQAISTKYTRLGFAINDSDKNLVLRIGEIDGEKEKINLEF